MRAPLGVLGQEGVGPAAPPSGPPPWRRALRTSRRRGHHRSGCSNAAPVGSTSTVVGARRRRAARGRTSQLGRNSPPPTRARVPVIDVLRLRPQHGQAGHAAPQRDGQRRTVKRSRSISTKPPGPHGLGDVPAAGRTRPSTATSAPPRPGAAGARASRARARGTGTVRLGAARGARRRGGGQVGHRAQRHDGDHRVDRASGRAARSASAARPPRSSTCRHPWPAERLAASVATRRGRERQPRVTDRGSSRGATARER